MKVDSDPYQRYGGLIQEIRIYTDRPPRLALVDPRQGLRPFGFPVTILSPDTGAATDLSILFAGVDGRFAVSGDEEVMEVEGARMVPFGPFEQVTITPTIRGNRRTASITYRHLGDLFVQAG